MSGKLSLSEIGRDYGVSRWTLDRWFKPFRHEEILPNNKSCSDRPIITDGYYVKYMAVVLIAQLPNDEVISWSFTYAENFLTWLNFFNQISGFPLAIVFDGQKGAIKAARTRWPGIIIQRCQFHVIHQVNLLLTKNPETMPAQEFKKLVAKISNVKTLDDWKNWIYEYKKWYCLYSDFLKERTFGNTLTPTGRVKWSYTHGRLHSAFSHIKNAFPYLFQYLKYPQIPNTSNRIEGSVNAFLQRKIDAHRGTNLIGQRQIISAFLRAKQG